MARNLREGQTIDDFTVEARLGGGYFATPFRATDKTGRRVFLKQYKVPTSLTPWYKGYIAYQAEMRRRIQSSDASRYCYEMIKFFEADSGGPCYFQAFEFLDAGKDLDTVLDVARRDPSVASWARRLTWARVFLKGLAVLHAQKIVHTDLKPPNIELLEDASIEAGYRVKLIDMDFTVLSDVKAPWHDDPGNNYVGTANYLSPEHLSGAVPTEASDVFTAALIVCEILARGGHPYAADDPKNYATAVRAHAVHPKLLERIPDADGATERLEAALFAALDPTPAARPTAADLHAALLGRPISIPAPRPLPPPRPPAPDAPPHLGGNVPLRLVMRRDGGADVVVITATIDTTLGQGRLLGAGDDARCWSSVQCRLIRHGEKWFLEPDSSARHATLLNGKTLDGTEELHPDDEISVGDEKRAIKKLPMRVEIGETVDA
ncbi:MAG: protein kinase [Candidatus Polarisedimenticolia bacterium]|nr:protein kinase [bacterium]